MSSRPNLRVHPSGRYRYLRGGPPYSSGVAAESGYRIDRVQFENPIPWREGFERIAAWLGDRNEPRVALCAIELRCPSPYSGVGFTSYNETYCEVLRSWGIFDEDRNPVARTNVAPSILPPEEQAMHAFSCAVEDADANPSFVVSGGGEVTAPEITNETIVRCGETSEEAIGEKAAYVIDLMAKRLEGLGFVWDDVKETNVYTIHPIDRTGMPELLPRMGAASRFGVMQIPSRPPVVDIEFEMDLRCVARQLTD